MMNRRVTIFCDNKSVVHMVNNLASTCIQCRKLIRILTIDGIRSNHHLSVQPVRTENNGMVDTISRLNWTKFWKLAPVSMNKVPDVIPSSINNPEKIWFNDEPFLLQL